MTIDPGLQDDLHPTTREDVIALYQQFLGRDPENEGAIIGRLGLPYSTVRNGIANSLEAEMRRTGTLLPIGPKGPQGPDTGDPKPHVPLNVPDIPGLTGALQWLYDALGGKVSEATKAANDAKQWLTDQLQVITAKALPVVQNSVKALEQQLANSTANLIPNTLSLIGAGVGGIGNLVSAIFSNMADVGDVAGAFVQAVKDHAPNIAGFIGPLGEDVLTMGINGAINAITEHHAGDFNAVIDRMLAVPDLSPHVAQLLSSAKDRENSPGAAAALGILLAALVGMAGAMAEPDIENARQFAWNNNPTRTIGFADAAEAAARGFAPYDTARELMRLDGLRPELHELIYNLHRRFPDVDALFAAFFRGALDEPNLNNDLRALGFGHEEINLLKVVMQNIPNVSDVLRFLVRDVFIPEFVEAFGMDKEYPALADEWAAKLGIPHDVMVLHWRAHWELPSVGQGYEMLQRNKISETDLRRLLRAQGVEPYWRDPLIEISYNPLTRVDIRRIHKTLGKDRKWLVEQYRFTGYGADNAETLADFTIALNAKEKRTELKDITDGLRGRVVSAVMAGSMDEETGRALLAQIGYANAEIDDFILEARLFRHDRRASRMVDLIGKLYVVGRRTRAEVTTRLSEAGFVPAEIDETLRELDLEKELKAPDDKQEKDRDLTKAEVLTAFSDRIVTEAEARAALVAMRYDVTEVQQLISIQKYKDKKAEDADAIEIVHQRFIKGTYDETTAVTELDKVVSNAQHRNALLAKWSKEHAAKVADIPLSSVQEMYQRDISDVAWTRLYLAHMGFDPDETERLMKLWDARKLEKAERDAAAKAKAAGKPAKGVVKA